MFEQTESHTALAPQALGLSQYVCTAKGQVVVAPVAFPLLLIPSVVVRLGRRI